MKLSLPVVLQHALIDLHYRIYYSPLLLRNAVSLDVGRKVPRAKAAADPTNLVDEIILPANAAMRSRSVVQTLNRKSLSGGHMKAQARFSYHIHVFIAPNDKNLIPHVNRRVGRNAIRQFPYFGYLVGQNIHKQYLPTLHIGIFVLAASDDDGVVRVDEGIRGVPSDVSSLEG